MGIFFFKLAIFCFWNQVLFATEWQTMLEINLSKQKFITAITLYARKFDDDLQLAKSAFILYTMTSSYNQFNALTNTKLSLSVSEMFSNANIMAYQKIIIIIHLVFFKMIKNK